MGGRSEVSGRSGGLATGPHALTGQPSARPLFAPLEARGGGPGLSTIVGEPPQMGLGWPHAGQRLPCLARVVWLAARLSAACRDLLVVLGCCPHPGSGVPAATNVLGGNSRVPLL